ncbi:uncharacterized protein N7459_000928 [Penicillium hispanicum]|uniref:uncharacterized protein n=1 Tax=Penicillium hispanicum TaxID=1080232 RepID=UPI00253F99AE|nr:uncharacterized protein N7459_000928 [Penicillium hispanicum]KAJ5594720.1 hypothetical protein N7459_000928 [Penicillium hispanicum]
MARSTTVVKSRTAPASDTISFPVLTYSDALPRDDLRDLNENAARRRQNQTDITHPAFPRPRTADGRTSRKPPPGPGGTFDFQLRPPPDEVLPTSARSARSPIGQHSIGVALGSPGMGDAQGSLPPPRFDSSIFDHYRTDQSPQPPKSSKWRKIGGLFRAKNALASPMQQSREGQSKASLSQDKLTGSPPKPAPRRGSTEEWPKIEVDNAPQRSRKFSLPRKTTKEKSNNGPMLDVDIPDVQMERYSVMFSSVMTKNQRPSLLARRSKTLDNLRVPSNQDFLAAAKVPPVPQRRATSPARSNFMLFPTSHPSKAAQVLGTQNFSRAPSPLLRSNTLPVESPSKSSGDHLRPSPNNHSKTSFESSFLSNSFSEHSNTPRSLNTHPRKEDKPLPAIKPETTISKTQLRTASPPVTKILKPPQEEKSVAPANEERKATKSPEKKVPPRKHDRHAARTQEARPKEDRITTQPTRHRRGPQPREGERQQHSPECEVNRPSRPRLKIVTQGRTPAPPARDISSSASSSMSLSSSSLPSSSSSSSSRTPRTPRTPKTPKTSKMNPIQEVFELPASPVTMSAGPKSGVSPSGSARMPFTTEREVEPDEPPAPIPRIELSTAKSVSVSKDKRQMLVPIGARVDHFHPNERLVDRKGLTPQITDVHRHKHGMSQELQIETM